MNPHASLCLILLTFILGVNPANAQILSGTVIFGMFTKDDLILTADSRGQMSVGDKITGYRDDQCKIAAVNGKIVFAISGFYAKEGPGGFDLRTEARSIASGAKINFNVDLLRVADAWAANAKTTFERLAKNPTEWNGVAVREGGTIADAIFATRDAVGNIIVSAAIIRRIPSATFAPFTSSETHLKSYRGEKFADFIGTGAAPDVISELGAGKTEWAKAHSGLLNRMRFSTTILEMENTTIEFSQLAERRFPDHVGGSIDQVHLGPNGVDWLKRKENCSEK
jgi:hypothetical protein